MSFIKLYGLLFCFIFLAKASDLSSLAWSFGKGGVVVAALNTMAYKFFSRIPHSDDEEVVNKQDLEPLSAENFKKQKDDWEKSFYGFSFSGSSGYVVGGIPWLLFSLSLTFAPFLTIDKNISIGVHLQSMAASFLGGCLLSPFLMQGLSKMIGKRAQNPFYHFEGNNQVLNLLNPYEGESFARKQFFLYPGCVNNL